MVRQHEDPQPAWFTSIRSQPVYEGSSLIGILDRENIYEPVLINKALEK